MKKWILLVVVLLVFWVWFYVQLGADPETGYYTVSNQANFLSGIWHGWWASINFIRSLFGAEIGIYETVNTGGWYDFGFLLGVSSLGGSASSSRSRE